MNNTQRKGNNPPRTFAPIPMTYIERLPHLTYNSLFVPIPLKPIQPPYPKTYDSNAKCEYHAEFKENGPNVGDNPLPRHGGIFVNAIKEKVDCLVRRVEKVKTIMGVIFSKLCTLKLIERLALKQILQRPMDSNMI
ncbi:hypothetical protein CR513_25115, partial [Mucuna pruriens]